MHLSSRWVGLRRLLDWVLSIMSLSMVPSIMSLSMVPWRLVIGRIGLG